MGDEMDKRIGVFDSGVGGLTVLKSLVEKMPHENFYYFGDTKNVPYGPRTPEDIENLTVYFRTDNTVKNIHYKDIIRLNLLEDKS